MNGKMIPRLLSRRVWQNALFVISIITLSSALVACGGGSGNSAGTNLASQTQDEGEIIIGLTDAEGDFHSYTVDVLSVKLIRQNGAEIETLPLSTRVDFAQYTELTEFLTAATVPKGIYTGASIVVDYSNADIVVEDATGAGVEATAVDSQGDVIGELELNVEFENTDTLRILPGIPAHITLDFDLAASNTVDTSVMPAIVTVEPILVADTLLEDPKPRRLRGLLNEVAVDEDVFSLFIRPFFRHQGDFGSIRVHSNDDTSYEIDMLEYLGHDGIVAMADLDERSPVIVLGLLDRDTREFTATDVVAGTSVPWGDIDMAVGNVLARSGNELTLSQVTLHRGDNDSRHQQLITVLIGDNTTVTQQGTDDAGLSIAALSVGQRVLVAGEFTDDLTLDASEGRVRMRYTHVNGTTINVQPLVVDVQTFDRRRASLFDFNGTGVIEDADPDNYEIDTASLSLSALSNNEAVRVIGHVRPFGTAPEDFNAQTVVALGELPAKLLLNWEEGTAPFLSQSSTEIVIDNDPAKFGHIHKILQGGIATNVVDLNQAITVQANSAGRGLFILAYQGRTRMYIQFEHFSNALTNLLDGANSIQGMHVHGRFDHDSATLTARKIVARVR